MFFIKKNYFSTIFSVFILLFLFNSNKDIRPIVISIIVTFQLL